MCEWRWTVKDIKPPDFVRIATIHIKVIDPRTEKYKKKTSSFNSPELFEYSVKTQNEYLVRCAGM